ncbi:MAG TPA: hypothetical protein VJN62_12500 [Gemmatimonadales bacterium]|nr:hypothetical protein [Gemmatimonadales bacterium]
MKEELPFDHEPDARLGAALRHALEPTGHDAFVARVLAGMPATRAGSWDILAGWAGRGIAAALLVALGAGFAAGRAMQPAAGSMEEALVTAPSDSGTAAAALVRGNNPPDASIVFAVRP